MNQEEMDRLMGDFLPYNKGEDVWIISEGYIRDNSPVYVIVEMDFKQKPYRKVLWAGSSFLEMESEWEEATGEAR